MFTTDTNLPPSITCCKLFKNILYYSSADFCKNKGERIEKLAIQFSIANPRIATTLFSTANAQNVKKNIAIIEEPINWELVHEVQGIIGDQQRVSWANS